ncbi:hypothetical protein KKE33_01095, partial [Patescibacteria group bacterium]|nr:hypothetical protein [Patescibacteria group bacterium]
TKKEREAAEKEQKKQLDNLEKKKTKPFWMWAEVRGWGSGDAQTSFSLTDEGKSSQDFFSYSPGWSKRVSKDNGKTWVDLLSDKDVEINKGEADSLSAMYNSIKEDRKKGYKTYFDERSEEE